MTDHPTRLAALERSAWYAAIAAGLISFLTVDSRSTTGKALLLTLCTLLLVALAISTVRLLRSGRRS